MKTISIGSESLITPKQLAESGAIGETKQIELRKSGQLEFIRVGHKIFYRAEALSRYFDRCTEGNRPTEGKQV